LGEIQTVYTGINVKKALADVRLFPNPNNGNFLLEINGVTGQFTLRILTVEGRSIYTEKVLLESANYTKSVELENLKPGLYMVELSGEGIKENRKLIVR
jgi:hypothetical protein